MQNDTQENRDKTMEALFWPFVLLVGTKITKLENDQKRRFWRDNGIMASLVVLPVTMLNQLSLSLPGWIYVALVAAGGFAYVSFALRWRKYLEKQDSENL